jgi:Flp pilus assembly pilin Flp
MRVRALLSDERGAEALEFALVFPVAAFLLFGLIYAGFAVAANVSLAHAASRGVRYASIAVDPLSSMYPSTAEVAAKVDDETPFFAADDCDTTLVGDSRENAPVTLDVVCDFPNPMGKALSGVKNFITGSDDEAYSDSLRITARAEGRRE